MSYFVGYFSLEGLLRSHRDQASPIYLGPWDGRCATGGDPEGDPRVLVSDVQDGVGRYCLITEREAVRFTRKPFDSGAIKQRIEKEFGLAVEEAVVSLPSLHYLHVVGSPATILPRELWQPQEASRMPNVDDR